MKSYYIIFEKSGKKICGCWKREKDKESALLAAEFALICHYSNVEYVDTPTAKAMGFLFLRPLHCRKDFSFT